jgi:hypothetical protein
VWSPLRFWVVFITSTVSSHGLPESVRMTSRLIADYSPGLAAPSRAIRNPLRPSSRVRKNSGIGWRSRCLLILEARLTELART